MHHAKYNQYRTKGMVSGHTDYFPQNDELKFKLAKYITSTGEGFIKGLIFVSQQATVTHLKIHSNFKFWQQFSDDHEMCCANQSIGVGMGHGISIPHKVKQNRSSPQRIYLCLMVNQRTTIMTLPNQLTEKKKLDIFYDMCIHRQPLLKIIPLPSSTAYNILLFYQIGVSI